MSAHKQRAHSKFSASGSERWLNCAASVALEEKSKPSVDTVWSTEGTAAHEVHETVLKIWSNPAFDMDGPASIRTALSRSPNPMVQHAVKSSEIIMKLAGELVEPELLIEQRLINSDLNDEFGLTGEDAIFGTGDAILVEEYGTLHIIDYKYGEGHIVDPKENTQMIQYALAAANRYDWAFTDVEVHIIQPRGGGKIHKRWGMTIDELKTKWLPLWRSGVKRVVEGKSKPFPGSYCYWCRAAKPGEDGVIVCPAKRAQIQEKRNDKVTNRFSEPFNERGENASQEESKKDIKPKGQSKGSQKAREAFGEVEKEFKSIVEGNEESWF